MRHAHGYVVQTLADLGLIGLGLSLFAAIAWMCAAARATGLRRRDRGLPFDPERIGLLTLATLVLIFGVHSLIDWTWFVPGNAVVALLAAGWVAGRPALRDRDAVVGDARGRRAAGARRRWPARPRRLVLIAARGGELGGAAAGPLRHARTTARRTPPRAASYDLAASRAKSAHERQDPLSLEPLLAAGLHRDAAGNPQGGRRALEQAVSSQPANAEAWRRLGPLPADRAQRRRGRPARVPGRVLPRPGVGGSASDLIEATRVAARQEVGRLDQPRLAGARDEHRRARGGPRRPRTRTCSSARAQRAAA